MTRIPELLAPAGNSDNFLAALDAGADAVYVGLPGFNARNLARDLRLEEIGAMIRHCHRLGKKLYVAANSLVFEQEIPQLLKLLASLAVLQPDALIIQDLGLLHLLRRYFPELPFHASTLMAAHNSASVRLYGELGCRRVVLARELTLAEIEQICRNSQVDVEVFIHGAMCFSYSGLCLFSSYLGGKSGLRGRCVQPCRRAYTVAGGGGKAGSSRERGGYLFSMNDLSGLAAVSGLKAAGVASLKIEGRQRSAQYVRSVVAAYRRILDAPDAQSAVALAEAGQLLEEAMSRKSSSGYFFSPQPAEAIIPYHSGNLGRYLGRVERVQEGVAGQFLALHLKAALCCGDRLRLHLEPSGDRLAFTLKAMTAAGQQAGKATAGQQVVLAAPDGLAAEGWRHIDCYLVDLAPPAMEKTVESSLPVTAVRQDLRRQTAAIEKRVSALCRQLGDVPQLHQVPAASPAGRLSSPKKPVRLRPVAAMPLPWWLRLASPEALNQPLPVAPEAIVLNLTQKNASQAGQLRRQLGKRADTLIWALPPVIVDQQAAKYTRLLEQLRRQGFYRFQLGHGSQLALLPEDRLIVSTDYTFNCSNAEALRQLAELGLSAAQLAIELDRVSLQQAIAGFRQLGGPPGKRPGKNRMQLGLTIYGWPALYTARLSPAFFPFDKPVLSPKKEGFLIRRGDGCSQTLPLQPFSLLPYLAELPGLGLDYLVVDLCGAVNIRRGLLEFFERLQGSKKYAKLPSFNFSGTLL